MIKKNILDEGQCVTKHKHKITNTSKCKNYECNEIVNVTST